MSPVPELYYAGKCQFLQRLKIEERKILKFRLTSTEDVLSSVYCRKLQINRCSTEKSYGFFKIGSLATTPLAHSQQAHTWLGMSLQGILFSR